MKILLIQAQGFINGSGGTEKICTALANNFASKHEVIIGTNENIEGKPMFKLDSSIQVTNIFDPSIEQLLPIKVVKYRGKNLLKWLNYKINKKKAKRHNKKQLKEIGFDTIYKFNLRQKSKYWKNYIDNLKPDLIITMSIGSLLEITYENTYNIPIINSVNGRPDYDYTDILWYRSPIDMEYLKESYSKLSGIQVLFENYKNFLPDTFNGICKVIANPVPQVADEEIVKYIHTKKQYTIISIGSLAINCKQQDLSIRAFARIADKYPNWNMEFWGVGSDQDRLEKLIYSLKLKGRVFMQGFTDTPLNKLKQSDIFIFPSKYEGFPLALTEAMSVGLPCLGLDSCSGVNELIQDEKNGYLCRDEEEIAEKLEILITNPNIRTQLGYQAHLDMKNYCPENILTSWNEFVDNIVRIEK